MKVILLDVESDDFVLAIRAVKWLLANPERDDAVLSYGERVFSTFQVADPTKDFYVKRNKAGITVRPTNRQPSNKGELRTWRSQRRPSTRKARRSSIHRKR